jgi:hypothetical protein
MSPKTTKAKHIKKDKANKGGRRINKTSRFILDRMIEGDNNYNNKRSSANLKGKGG